MIRHQQLTWVVRMVLFLVFSAGIACGQAVKEPRPGADSGFVFRAQKAIRRVEASSMDKYREERVSLGQQRTIENIEKEIQAAKVFMKSELDTGSLSAEMRKASESFAVVKEGISVGKGTIQTHRNLTISSAILTQLLRDMSARKSQVDKMTQRLVGHRYKLDSLSTDSLLYTLSADSAKIISYLRKLTISNLSISPADSLIDKTIVKLQATQARLDPLVFELDLALEGLEAEKQRLSGLLFHRELPSIWHQGVNEKSFSGILMFSAAKEKMAFDFYLRNYLGRFLIVLAALAISTIFLRSLRQRYREHSPPGEIEKDSHLALNNPFISSVLIVLSLFQFILVDPPFIISFCFWLISIVSLTIIFRGVIARYWMVFWINISFLFFLACCCNLILQASEIERRIMLVLSALGACYGIYILRDKNRDELQEEYIIYAIRFMVVLEAFSALFNVYGRYNLSKTLMMSGYIGLVIAILFLWTVRLIDDSLRLANSLYKNPDRKLFYVNFDKLGNRAPGFLYVLLCIGWLIVVGRNYYEFKQVLRPFNQYITETRTIGDYEFTIRDLLLFVGISTSSVMISRIVSFFATEPGIHAYDAPKSGSSIAANWLLLIRIIVITSGILLAFAASGIPLDRLTIIIGALGVGIGLGLQNLVSNLVSGLIIAFERPVSVGDQVEVNGKLGTMKSVGFRSSIITLVDGACMIVPNGDLLSQQLINWTMGKDKRRLMITVGVAYGTDLAAAKEILMNMLMENDKIMQRPQPMVIATEFNTSSIDLNLIFWVRNLDQSFTVRDEVIGQVDSLFRQNQIVIPFPQQDIYIKAFDRPDEKK